MTLTNDAWSLMKENDRKYGESLEDYQNRTMNGYPCKFCNSGRMAQHNAVFEEPRCMECIERATNEIFPSMEETQTQLNQAANEGHSPRYQITGLTPTVQTSGASFPPGFSEDMKSEPFDAAWQLIKGRQDAPNYRKATGSKKCGNCKAWDSSKTDDPMTGYCKWYDFNCRADHVCDAWAAE